MHIIKTTLHTALLTSGVALSPAIHAAPAQDASSSSRPSDNEVMSGYRAELVLSGLTYPTSVEFDEAGAMYVAEGGYAPGDPVAPARIFRISRDGTAEVVADDLMAPVMDLLWHDGSLLISHRGTISSLSRDGALHDLVTGLPSSGDHANNQLAAGPDGKIYFGQGTVTNSGVVGLDSFMMGWLPKHPDLHDVPPRDIQLRGQTFETPNPLKLSKTNTVTTSPFHGFGETGGSTVQGKIKANGTILRMNADGSGLEVYAWGLRNPVGVMWGPDGNLYATENGFDVRGSRPIANDPEDLYVIRQGAWYGWPDFASGKPVTDSRFKADGKPAPQFLLESHPDVEQPLMTFPPHSAVAKIDFGSNGDFGHEGSMFIAFWGHLTPMTGTIKGKHGGHRVLVVDPSSKQAKPFMRARHADKGSHQSGRGHGNQGARHEHGAPPSLRRPIDVRFTPDGTALYIVDFGALSLGPAGPQPAPGTGAIWRVVRDGLEHAGPPSGMKLQPHTVATAEGASGH